jgi:hypothetical protein
MRGFKVFCRTSPTRLVSPPVRFAAARKDADHTEKQNRSARTSRSAVRTGVLLSAVGYFSGEGGIQ